jgi:hypothetical protein
MSNHKNKTTERPSILDYIGLPKLGLQPPWECSGWKRLDDGLIVYFNEKYIKSSGKNKGKEGWRKTAKQTFISLADTKEGQLKWEAETGKCSICGGDGIEEYGFSVAAHLRECTRCNGSGKSENERRGK